MSIYDSSINFRVTRVSVAITCQTRGSVKENYRAESFKSMSLE